jgi:uncharacterized surface protein with fasciclin (FAS1) repeats
MKTVIKSLVAAGIVLALAAPVQAGEKKDIVDTAVAAGSFTTLAKALGAAGLVDTLKGTGPFTVFAAGTLEKLLADKAQLSKVLTYHVVAGKVMAADVVKLKSAKTVEGADVKITVKDKGVMVNQAHVVKTDIETSNGVIHVIDAVLLPPAKY